VVSTAARRVVVITGASAGVGRATARAFAKEGAAIALLARGHAGLQAAAKDVASFGGTALPIAVDVTDRDALERAAEEVEEKLGAIDVWVNDAFSSVFGTFLQVTPDEFERVTAVTYLGFVNGTRTALTRMTGRNRGTIIQVGSALAYRSIPLQSAYCGAKHAVLGFTDAIRCELLHDRSKVRLSMVQLPAHNTPQFSWVRSHLPKQARPVPPIFQPEVAADAIVWASHHYRREWHVTFSAARAILAQHFAPGLLDHYLARYGYQSQLTRRDRPAHAPDNLWSPLDEHADHGAHGDFDLVARGADWHWQLNRKRRVVLGGAAGLVLVAARASRRAARARV
jgi:NADP-dependent 3-hydroxy acid dehydrogenase YdfG